MGETLAGSYRKHVKPQSKATAKHKIPKPIFKSANQKIVEFHDEHQKLATDAFGIAEHTIIEQFKNAKKPPHLSKPIK